MIKKCLLNPLLFEIWNRVLEGCVCESVCCWKQLTHLHLCKCIYINTFIWLPYISSKELQPSDMSRGHFSEQKLEASVPVIWNFQQRDMKAPTHLKGIRRLIFLNKSIDIHCQIAYKKVPVAFCSCIGWESISNDYIPESNMFSSCFSEGLSSFAIVI